jgi:tRNA(Ile)-lysidine synthase
VACSGGADSLALAHLAITRAKRAGSTLPVVAHINHGLRPEAAAEAAAVRRFAHDLGAECLVRTVDVASQGASLEARAREARYLALDACASKVDAAWVLLAHTKSDQAETVFMRILRGTGLVGLSGMAAVRGIYGRPLLGVTREDTEAYCAKHGLEYSHDPMNREQRFTRVRIRHHWLPILREENPRFQEALCGLADSARDHRAVLDWAASRALDDCTNAAGNLQLGKAFQSLPDALAARVVALFVEGSSTRPLERSHIDALLGLCRSATSGSRRLSLPGGDAVRIYDELVWGSGNHADSCTLEIPEGFSARRWQAGDRMRPRRLKGRSKKLSDLFADAKVPASERASAWVVISSQGDTSGEIVWAQHVGHADGWNVRVNVIHPAEQGPE